jgi:hypothetical protein
VPRQLVVEHTAQGVESNGVDLWLRGCCVPEVGSSVSDLSAGVRIRTRGEYAVRSRRMANRHRRLQLSGTVRTPTS